MTLDKMTSRTLTQEDEEISKISYKDFLNNKRAYFVIGSEGSGTYMLWDALQDAGCHAEGWHNGIFPDYKFETMPDLLTVRRSYPHAGEWPYLGQVVNPLLVADYEVTILWIVRDWNATMQSIARRKYERVMLPLLGQMRLATKYITRQLNKYSEYPMIMVSYEAFCLTPGYRKWLFEDMLGLKNPVDFEIKYANNKYYEGEL